MNKKVVLLIVLTVMTAIFVATVYSGAPPVFRSQTLRIEGAAYVLNARYEQLDMILMDQPKLPNPNGLIGKFNAMNTDIMVINHNMTALIPELTDLNMTHVETINAIIALGMRAIEFQNLAGLGLEILPYHEGVYEALDGARINAGELFTTASILCGDCHGGTIPID